MERNKQLTAMTATIERALNETLIAHIDDLEGLSPEEASDISFNVTCSLVAKLCALGIHEGADKTKALTEVCGVMDQQIDGWLRLFRKAEDEQDAEN